MVREPVGSYQLQFFTSEEYAPSGDTDIVYRGAAFTPTDFADFWGKFAVAINGVTGNDERVAFDLINEPHTHAESGNKAGDIGIDLAAWFSCAQAAINAIRAAGATNTIFACRTRLTQPVSNLVLRQK